MAAGVERRCICGHAEKTHVFDQGESICSAKGCLCTEFCLWQVVFEDPRGSIHVVPDIAKFVRDNPHLFDPNDLIPSTTAGKKGLASTYIRAESALTSIGNRFYATSRWKGWRTVSYPRLFKSKQQLQHGR